jgi:hypothetical protein
MAHFLNPLIGSSERYGLLVERTGDWLADSLQPAFDSTARKKGLLGRNALDDGTAVVIAPSQGVHTIGMRFPIDIVAVSRDGCIVKLREAVGPWRLMIALSAFAIIELPAGTCARAGVRRGDRLRVVQRETHEVRLQ